MRILFAAAVILAAAACTSPAAGRVASADSARAGAAAAAAPGTAPDAPMPDSGDGVFILPVMVPDEVAGFVNTQTFEFPDPTLGVRLHFESAARVVADVYLYPIYPFDLARSGAGRDSAARLEYRRALDDVSQNQRNHGEPAPALLAERAMSVRAGAELAHGRRASLRMVREGVDSYSHLYLFCVRDRYVKVRTTVPALDGHAEPPPGLDRFVRELVAAVDSGYGRGPPRADGFET